MPLFCNELQLILVPMAPWAGLPARAYPHEIYALRLILALMTEVEVDLGIVMRQRLQIIGSVMRSQPLDNKIAITQRFRDRWLPLLENGAMQPIIDTTFPLADAAAAHQYMEENRNTGKIILVVD